MSASASPAASAHAIPGDPPRLVKPATLFGIGAVFIVLTAVGWFMGAHQQVAFSWLIALSFWTAVSLGSLLLVMIHHIFDAGWSTVIRRTLEHWLAVFLPLGVLFLPLVIVSLTSEPAILWKWLDTHDPKIAGDILWVSKSAFLNPRMFAGCTVGFFLLWFWLSWLLRKHSFAQDEDGSVAHTYANRRNAAFGIPLTALSLTGGACFWFMSLEYHWYSTMYGVWYFARSIRAALAFVTLLMIYLTSRGVLRGIMTKAHLLNLGNVMLAFTVFWAYISFSQYFLIWNANVPEETFWYNIRETGNWVWVGMALVFGHFLFQFLYLLQYPLKKKHGTMIFICVWILATQLLDLFFNILPAQKLENGDPVPFGISPWDVTSFIAVGAVCLGAFFASFAKTRCIPVRDPRIVESLHLHE